jgi:DNA mismatch repair protein MutS2
MLNASMEFDQTTFTPLYRLRVGEPGQSHAIEIARRYGLPESIVDSAKALLGGVKVEFDNLIRDLTEKRAYYENAVSEIEKQKIELEAKRKLIDAQTAAARREHDAIVTKAYSDAAELAASIKRELYDLLEAAKKAEKDKIKETLKAVETRKKRIDEALVAQTVADAEAPTIEAVSNGDLVYVTSINADAQVIDIDRRHERVKVKFGSIEVEVPFSAIRNKKGKKTASSKMDSKPVHTTEERAVSSITVIGLRVNDALSRIEPFLNHAALAGLLEVVIIHGIGAGILMKAIREHLEGHPLVSGYRGGEQHEGGRGVTVVTLK